MARVAFAALRRPLCNAETSIKCDNAFHALHHRSHLYICCEYWKNRVTVFCSRTRIIKNDSCRKTKCVCQTHTHYYYCMRCCEWRCARAEKTRLLEAKTDPNNETRAPARSHCARWVCVCDAWLCRIHFSSTMMHERCTNAAHICCAVYSMRLLSPHIVVEFIRRASCARNSAHRRMHFDGAARWWCSAENVCIKRGCSYMGIRAGCVWVFERK